MTPTNSSRSQRRVLLALVAILVLALLAWMLRRSPPTGAAPGPAADRAAPDHASTTPGVSLDTDVVRQMGIVTVPISTAMRSGTTTLTGILVPDPSGVTTVRAPIAGRLVDAAGHWPVLGQYVAAGTTLGQVADALPMRAPRGGMVTQVGAHPGELVQPGQVLLVLTDFAHPLAQVVWRASAPPLAPRRVTLAPLGDSSAARTGVLIGAAPVADTLTGFPMFLYRVQGAWSGARPGLPVLATISDPGQMHRGVFVPGAAAVQWNGFVWVYVQRRPGRFDRVRLDTSAPVSGGWLAQGGVRAGDEVVTRGTGQLLSEELRVGPGSGGNKTPVDAD